MKFDHTPGPWSWSVNKSSHSVALVGFKGGSHEYVMDFKRYGMAGAKPRFNIDGLMHDADKICEVVPGREHHASWYQTINHPDARLIAAAPEMLKELRKCFKDGMEGYQMREEQAIRIKNLLESATGKTIEEILKIDEVE